MQLVEHSHADIRVNLAFEMHEGRISLVCALLQHLHHSCWAICQSEQFGGSFGELGVWNDGALLGF